MKRNGVFLLGVFLVLGLNAVADEMPFAWKGSDTLVVNDGMTKQHYLFKDGLLTLVEVVTLKDNHTEIIKAGQEDRSAGGQPRETRRSIIRYEATERTAGYYQLELHSSYDDHEVRRTLRKYDDVPGIEWGMQVKGDADVFEAREAGGADLIEDPDLLTGHNLYSFFLPFSSPHYTTSVFSFQEATDHHTNIVYRRDALPYRKSQYYRGSVLLAENNQTGGVHLVVKKSPIERAQSDYAGYDFSTDFTGVKMHSPHYTVFVVMNAQSEYHALEAYKLHELAVHRYLPERDNTFTMNTWGDRNRDSRVNEAFILNELEVAKRIGVTHYQIDDGWQQGLSRNSAAKAGMLWDDWKASDWEVNSSRFPNGLTKVREAADRLGMHLGLWFNPSKANDYAFWERDQEILLGLHERYGITWIKIDGLEIGNKVAEEHVDKMLGGAVEKSEGKLQFNMDVTAGHRGGYFYFNHFGNIFLENRYTDWGNYYPHMTLRNAWILAHHVPIQRFQIEWLNKWRNDNQYPVDDPLKPSRVPFDYQFAITMMGQPLAWMEATGLPEEAFEVASLIDAWKSVRGEMQQGRIVPIGDEPNGYGFPGFVSYGEKRVFVLLFRENASNASSRGADEEVVNGTYSDCINSLNGNLKANEEAVNGTYWLPEGDVSNKRFVQLGGDGILVGANGDQVEVQFEKPFQFLFGYFE